MRFATQALVAAAAVGAVAGGSSAFTAGITGMEAKNSIGQAATVTSGYTISTVAYVFGAVAADADKITTVTFTLVPGDADAPPKTTKIRLLTSGGYTITCSTPASPGPYAVSCPTGGVAASTVNTLDVLVTSF